MNSDHKVTLNLSLRKYGQRLDKSLFQAVYDFLFFPLVCVLPYKFVQLAGLTDLGRERRRAVLPHLRGKILDVGCGPLNELKNEYAEPQDITSADVFQWGHVDVVCQAEHLPFEDRTFDTVIMLACLNHFSDRGLAVKEASRVLKDDGRLLITMISPGIGYVVHKVCYWYDYDRVRGIGASEKGGLSKHEVLGLLEEAGFAAATTKSFLYRLNNLYLSQKLSTSRSSIVKHNHGG